VLLFTSSLSQKSSLNEGGGVGDRKLY